MDAHDDKIVTMALFGNILFSVTNSELKVWDLNDWKCIYCEEMSGVKSIFCQDGVFFTGSLDGAIRMFIFEIKHEFEVKETVILHKCVKSVGKITKIRDYLFILTFDSFWIARLDGKTLKMIEKIENETFNTNFDIQTSLNDEFLICLAVSNGFTIWMYKANSKAEQITIQKMDRFVDSFSTCLVACNFKSVICGGNGGILLKYSFISKEEIEENHKLRDQTKDVEEIEETDECDAN